MTARTDAARRHRIRPPQYCTAHIDRMANLGRQMDALETVHRELIQAWDKHDFVNKVYTFGRLIKDTSVGFLELAGALAGGSAEKTATISTALIDSAQSASEMARGQAEPAEIARRTLNTVNSFAGEKPGAIMRQMKVQQGLNFEKMVADARAADTATARRRAIANGLVKALADTVESMGELADNERIKYVAGLVKGVQNYHTALNETFEQRLEFEYEIAVTRQVYLHNNKQIMQRLRKDFNEAMDQLNKCQGREVRPQR